MVRGEERLSADKFAPHADQDSADNHTEYADTDTGDNADQDRQDDVGSEFAEQQRPAVLTLGHVPGVVTVVLVRVRAVSVALTTHHVRAAMEFHALELLDKNGAPLAKDSRALLGHFVHMIWCVLRSRLLDLSNEKFTAWALNQVDPDVGQAINKDRADLDDLKIHLDQVKTLVSELLNWVDLQAEAKLLLDGLGSVLVGSKFVVALQGFGVLLLLVLGMVLATVVSGLEVGDLGGN